MDKHILKYVDLAKQWEIEKEFLLPVIEEVLASGSYIGGEKVFDFETRVAEICKTKFAVALNSGTDALVCSLYALGIKRGDEVITPPNSFIASTSSIVHLGATPVFVDVLEDQNIDPNRIIEAITPKTKAIMPVHLTGRVCEMDKILEIAKEYNLLVIEDSAQSIGSVFNGQMSGSFGDAGCFSAHPLKNLNACGDGGFVVTNSESLCDRIKRLRNHGLVNRNIVEEFAHVSRLDVLQASILVERLKNLDEVISVRQKNAGIYDLLLDKDYVYRPLPREHCVDTFHTYVIQVDNRDRLCNYLNKAGIETAIHYPVPIHLQPAAKFLGYKRGDFPICEIQSERILSLPINQNLQTSEIERVATTINTFFKNGSRD